MNQERERDGNNGRRRKEEWYDIERNRIDMKKMAATDLPFNSRTYLPRALDESTEIEMHVLKQKVKTLAEKYKEGNKKGSKNLTNEQYQGIQSLRRRRMEGEIVVYQTDKSAKMAVDTPENYVRCMEPHIEKDVIITRKDHEVIEKTINAHAICWIRFMQAAKDTEDMYRVKMSMQSHNNEPSCLYSLRKDHKESVTRVQRTDNGAEEVFNEGPPVRPVCDVSDGISHRLSYLLSNMLKELCYGESVCNSTEEMLAAIEKTNANGIEDDYVIGSADVKALYPSIPIEDAVY